MEKPDVQSHSIERFIQRTGEKDRGHGMFEQENDRLLEVNLDGRVWIKTGTMVAYAGEMKFIREGFLEHGITRLLKRFVSGEGARLTKVAGKGRLYVADEGKKVSIIHLDGNALYVNGNDILAFQETIRWDIKLMKKLGAMVSGGLFNIRLEGTGFVAISTHHDPLTLQVLAGKPIITDPNATVAWSDSLNPSFKTDVSLKTFLGRGSGESVQMKFDGDGFVVVQPYEERSFQTKTRQ